MTFRTDRQRRKVMGLLSARQVAHQIVVSLRSQRGENNIVGRLVVTRKGSGIVTSAGKSVVCFKDDKKRGFVCASYNDIITII